MFSILFNMEVFCVYSLESPHRGDVNGYTQYTNYPKSATKDIFQGTQERVRNSPRKRVISV